MEGKLFDVCRGLGAREAADVDDRSADMGGQKGVCEKLSAEVVEDGSTPPPVAPAATLAESSAEASTARPQPVRFANGGCGRGDEARAEDLGQLYGQQPDAGRVTDDQQPDTSTPDR